jgi:choline-sulfatase
LQPLKRNGLYFQRAYTAACQCSPSRGLLLTGRFAPVNRVTRTFLWPGLPHQDRQPNSGSLLKEKAGYDVIWKGKWHLSYASNAMVGNGEDWGPADIGVMEKNWGWSGWNPPDAGNAIQEWEGTPFGKINGMRSLGGAFPNNDGRYVSGIDPQGHGQTAGVGGKSVVEFLKERASQRNKPFCMFVSLVNPHDIGVYPGGDMKPPAWEQAGYRRDNFANLGIKLPSNYADDLSTKPKIQKMARDAYDKFAPLNGAQAQTDYVNFYPYLHTVVDKHITTILDTLQDSGLADNTIILRIADDGKGGLSHGMREKAYTVYEEMIHIPLIVHNPKLYPESRWKQQHSTTTSTCCRLYWTLLALPMRSRTVSARASFLSSRIHQSPCRIIRFIRTTICSSCRPVLRVAISGRSAKVTGPMRCISASKAPDWTTNYTISRTIPAS